MLHFASYFRFFKLVVKQNLEDMNKVERVSTYPNYHSCSSCGVAGVLSASVGANHHTNSLSFLNQYKDLDTLKTSGETHPLFKVHQIGLHNGASKTSQVPIS